MLLRKIRLKNFKKFKDIEREFSPGINVVKGTSNEMGKSTLLEAIVTAMFENPKSARRELEKYTTWGSNRKCNTFIEFEVQGNKYVLEKDFEAKNLRFEREGTVNGWSTPPEVSEKLLELIGTDSTTLFLSTACIRQNEVTDILSGKKEIGTSLEGIVTGGNEQVVASRVAENLTKQINIMAKGLDRPTKEPGPIASLLQQISKTQDELTHINEVLTRVEQQKIDLVKISDRLASDEVKLKEAGALLEKNKRRQQIEGTIERLEDEYKKIDESIREISSLEKQIQQTEEKLKAIEGLDNKQKVAEIKRSLQTLQVRREEINTDLPKRRSELKGIEDYFKDNGLRIFLASKIALIIGAIIAVAGFLGMLLHIASVAIGVIGLIYLIFAFWVRSSVTQQKTRMADIQERIKQMEEAVRDIQNEESSILSKVNCSSAEEFSKKELMYSELVEQRIGYKNQLVGKLGPKTIEQLDQEKHKIARNLAIEKEKVTDELLSTKLSPEEYVQLEKKVEQLADEKTQLDLRKIECEVGIKSAKFDSEDQTQQEETLASLTNALKQERKKMRVFQIAKDFIVKARAETLMPANAILQAQIQKYFEIFTNHKYKKVIVDKDSLDFHIYSDEKDDWVKPEDLSAGVIDEFYLACRIALVNMLYEDKKPPIILDDPFTNFDSVRLSKALELFRQLSQEYQIIIFTLSDTYDNVADKVIQLAT